MFILKVFFVYTVVINAEPILKVKANETMQVNESVSIENKHEITNEPATIKKEDVTGIVDNNINKTATTHAPARRTLRGRTAGDTRPYMVYLRPCDEAEPKIKETNWLCGGVIIHPQYVLTSAACIEDVKRFYVISGTHKWLPVDETNECIRNGAKKALWKRVPIDYHFDGNDFDNIRWMVGDIAVVKVEDPFNFERRIRGCDFVPKMVQYNNRSRELEKGGTAGSVAGWGSTDLFGDLENRPAINSQDLLETDVRLISKKACKKRWDPRYHYIIDDYMICSKDTGDDVQLNDLCAKYGKEISCKDVAYSEERDYDYEDGRRSISLDPKDLIVDTAAHIDLRRNGQRAPTGGFCENDHGGPLVVGHGKSSVVVGIMSACLTNDLTHKCHGPFLYTSVFKYRNLISCAIDNQIMATCRSLLRTSKTSMSEISYDWSDLSVGRSKTILRSSDSNFTNISNYPLKPPSRNYEKF